MHLLCMYAHTYMCIYIYIYFLMYRLGSHSLISSNVLNHKKIK